MVAKDLKIVSRLWTDELIDVRDKKEQPFEPIVTKATKKKAKARTVKKNNQKS